MPAVPWQGYSRPTVPPRTRPSGPSRRCGPNVLDVKGSRVLVTDGEFKHSLGIVRALAGREHEVHVLALSARAPAVHSRAVAAWHRVPGPRDPGFDEAFLAIAQTLAPVSLVPVGDGAIAAAHRLRSRWPEDVRVALPPPESLEIANDKARSAELAGVLGVSVPRQMVAADSKAALRAFRQFGSPVVVKGCREAGRKILRYVRREADVATAFERVRAESGEAPLVQEYLPGEGWGFFALYWQGACLRQFMHRRVREWPPSGGTSACAESIVVAPDLERAGRRLLDALAWHGVAMVEFRRTPAGRLAFLEVNAKFWGSLDLALAAGVDFPGDLVARLEGGPLPEEQAPYRQVRFAWPLGGDLWHGLVRPRAMPRVLADLLSPRVVKSMRMDDPVPHFYEFLQWARSTPSAWREFWELR